MITHSPPHPLYFDGPCPYKQIFLAGSIEMGAAELWQDKVIEALENTRTIVYNPRRDDWDSSWGEGHPELIAQIEWEIINLKLADIVFMYFDPATKSPVTMLELGLTIPDSEQKFILICPPGFYRRQNIITTCKIFDIEIYDSLDEGIAELKKYLKFSIG